VAFFDFLKRKKAPATAAPKAASPGAAAPASHAPIASPAASPVAAPVVAPVAAPVVPEAQPIPASDEADIVALVAPDPLVDELAVEPLPEEPDHDGPERRDRIRRKARTGTRVLVIDDSPTIVALLKRMLQQNQLDVLEAFDAETGIEIARREVPDLIFLDIVLPGMDGFRALRTLRRDPITKHLPIIMISGNAQATEQFYVQRIGADDFMKKPFSRAEVFNRVEALLDADGIPRHSVKPGTRAEAAEAAGH
jgi:twitching motility two-component system response regulator PilH